MSADSARGQGILLYAGVGLLHLLGIALLLAHWREVPLLPGLAFTAYMLGLRHAFDADHIAAIDDTVRLMVQRGKPPFAVGFFFSLGHSTVVLVAAIVLSLAAARAATDLPWLRHHGALVGTAVSGVFLCVIGLLNLRVLLDLLRVWRRVRHRSHGHEHLERLLAGRGLMHRLFGGRLRGFIAHAWQMYPLGLLFGLGFDTATEIALLAMTAGAAGGALPLPAVLCLPLLFAAGMSLMDTTDGVLMTRACRWAQVNPLRKVFYNLGTTGLSVVAALGIGGIELLQVVVESLQLRGPWPDRIAAVGFDTLGYGVAGVLLLSWVVSVSLWKLGGSEAASGSARAQRSGIGARRAGADGQ